MLAKWADNSGNSEGDMGTNVVWMMPQLWNVDGKKAHH